MTLLLALSSCGQKDRLPKEKSKSVIDYYTLEQVLYAFKVSNVVCNGGDCPGNVAKLTFWYPYKQGYQLAVCSGTLIDEEYILTNSHCIPDHIQFSGADCSKNIKISFPDTNLYYEETLTCEKVVQAFSVNDQNPDLAVIKVSKSYYDDRAKTVIKKNSFIDHESAYAYTMNPSTNNDLIGSIVKKECQISLDNFIFDKITEGFPDSFELFGDKCKLIGGNSGSGLFNLEGELIGVISTRIDSDLINEVFNDLGLTHDTFTHMGGAVNVSCLKKITESQGVGCKILTPTEKEKKNALNYILKKVKEEGLDTVNYKNIRYKFNKQTELILTEDYNCPKSKNLNYLIKIMKTQLDKNLIKAMVRHI